MQTLIEFIGGPEAFESGLDYIFNQAPPNKI
jgi:hypothetical protein